MSAAMRRLGAGGAVFSIIIVGFGAAGDAAYGLGWQGVGTALWVLAGATGVVGAMVVGVMVGKVLDEIGGNP